MVLKKNDILLLVEILEHTKEKVTQVKDKVKAFNASSDGISIIGESLIFHIEKEEKMIDKLVSFFESVEDKITVEEFLGSL